MTFKSVRTSSGGCVVEVDAILDQQVVQPCSFVSGRLKIRAEELPRNDEFVRVELVVRYYDEWLVGYHNEVISSSPPVRLPSAGGGSHEPAFTLYLPPRTPITTIPSGPYRYGDNYVWLNPRLAESWITDDNSDRLTIEPNQAQSNVIEAMELLGCHLQSAEVMPPPPGPGECTQEFRFWDSRKPTHAPPTLLEFEQQVGDLMGVKVSVAYPDEYGDNRQPWRSVALTATTPESAAKALRAVLD